MMSNMLSVFLLAGLVFILNYRGLAVEVIFGTLTLWLLVEVIQVLVDRARPLLGFEGMWVIGWHKRGLSFSSDHTAQTFSLATPLSHYFQSGIGGTIALYAIAVLVGFTRM